MCDSAFPRGGRPVPEPIKPKKASGVIWSSKITKLENMEPTLDWEMRGASLLTPLARANQNGTIKMAERFRSTLPKRNIPNFKIGNMVET